MGLSLSQIGASAARLGRSLLSAVASDLRRVQWHKVALNMAGIVAGAAVLIAVALLALNTPSGRRVLVQYATGIKLNSGLQFEIGSIDGSLYGEMTLRDVKVKDLKGVFITSPLVHLDWRPFGALTKHVDIRDLSSPRIEVLRRPVLKAEAKPKSSGPILPDMRIDVDRLQIDTVHLAPGVFGDSRNAMLSGAAHTSKSQARINTTVLSDKGDRLHAVIDAAPDQNRLDIDVDVRAPVGSIAGDMLGLKKPLVAAVVGKGTWAEWNGIAQVVLDREAIVYLKANARKGQVIIAGDTYPDRLLSGESVALLTPAVHVDARITAKDRRLDLTTTLASDALRLDASGRIDLAANRFDHLEAHARLLKPERLGKGFGGEDLRADLMFDGAFDAWKVDYDLVAKRVDLGAIRLVGFEASGKSHRDGDRIVVPLDARLTNLTGIDTRVDPLLGHVRLSGDLAIIGTTVRSDNLRLKSDRLAASGDLQGDLASMNLASNIKASLNQYSVDGIGTLNLVTTARVVRQDGRLQLNGGLTAKTTELADALTKVLGGNAKASANFALGPDGAFTLRNVKGAAPLVQVLSGDARFGPNGALGAHMAADTTRYGPVDATVSGTFAAPVAVVKAPRPGLGVGLVDLVARLDTSEQGYAITAEGGSLYGPVAADAVILKGSPLSIDIHRAQFAGVDAAGKIVQTSGGPFAGTLTLGGSGLVGTANLSDAGGNQAAVIKATGTNTAFPGAMKGQIGRTIIDVSAVIRKELELTGDIQVADLTYAGVSVATGRAKVHMQGQTGTIQAVASGRGDLPFDLALNGDLTPNRLTLAAKGAANGVAFSLDHPARLSRSGEDWILEPVAVTLDGGKLNLAGRLGATKTLKVRLIDVDLSVANLFRKDLGINGRADGAIDFTQTGEGFPTAKTNLKIRNFSRASAAVVSAPVDMTVEAALDPSRAPDDNYVRAVIRQGGGIIGQVQMALSPAPQGGWPEQVLNAGVSGGVRYNGPAGVPFSLAGLPRQQLSGPVAVAADVSGRLSAPHLSGVIKASALTYDNDTFGTRISSLAVDGVFSDDRLELTRFSGKAGNGTVKGSGWLSLAADQNFPMQIHVDMSNARLARSDAIDSTVSGTLDIRNSPAEGALVTGDLHLPEMKYVVTRQGAAAVTVLDGVRFKGANPASDVPSGAAPPSLWKLDIKIAADNQIFVSGMGLESEWRMNLHLIGTTQQPRIVGDMHAIRGTYAFAGRDFVLSDGVITFDGATLTNPVIKLNAEADVNGVTGIINVSGSARHPDIAFSSTPALPQDEVLSRILFGQGVANISATEALQLASAVNGLNGGMDYLNPLGALRAATGVDRLRLVGADATTGRGTGISAGKYLTNNVYVEVVTDTKGFTATQIEIALSRALSILSQTGGTNGTTVSVRYSKDY